MSERVGCARCSPDKQDLTAQREILLNLDVPEDRIYLDHGLTGTNRDRPGLAQTLAAVRADDTLVAPKLDRLARSLPDARDLAEFFSVSRATVHRVLERHRNAPAHSPSVGL
ncbi:recombinase family protein [Streptomyces hirsutus]|uniref:recombinase family protein n=1 Tax=Streptomyces hirsutus TaxID=35620 RepID=UPI0033CE9E99